MNDIKIVVLREKEDIVELYDALFNALGE